MTDNRAKLLNEVKILEDYIERNLFEERFTERRAKEALLVIGLIWAKLDRRRGIK